jgi:hypothetical protein
LVTWWYPLVEGDGHRPWYEVRGSFAYPTDAHPDGRHVDPYLQVRWGLAYPVGAHPLAGLGRPLFDVGEHLVTPIGDEHAPVFVVAPDDAGTS